MKNLLIFLMLISAQQKPVIYKVDPSKSEIKWTGYAAAGAYAPTGTIKIKSGQISIINGRLTAAKVIADMPTLSNSTQDLQTHLRGNDFFAVDKYPEATFILSSVNGNTAMGSLTIKGITNKINFPYTINLQNGAVIVKAAFDIDRTQFGIKYNSSSYFQDLGSYAIKNDFHLDMTLSFPGDQIK